MHARGYSLNPAANRGEARKCLQKAREWERQQRPVKALKFAKKAVRLAGADPSLSDDARLLQARLQSIIDSRRRSPSSPSPGRGVPQPEGRPAPHAPDRIQDESLVSQFTGAVSACCSWTYNSAVNLWRSPDLQGGIQAIERKAGQAWQWWLNYLDDTGYVDGTPSHSASGHLRQYVAVIGAIVIFLLMYRIIIGPLTLFASSGRSRARSRASRGAGQSSSSGFGFGGLPGDVHYTSGNFTVYSPIMSMFLLSVFGNWVMQLLRRRR